MLGTDRYSLMWVHGDDWSYCGLQDETEISVLHLIDWETETVYTNVVRLLFAVTAEHCEFVWNSLAEQNNVKVELYKTLQLLSVEKYLVVAIQFGNTLKKTGQTHRFSSFSVNSLFWDSRYLAFGMRTRSSIKNGTSRARLTTKDAPQVSNRCPRK